MTRRLGDDHRLQPALSWEFGPPDPPPEGPEVWCHSCQWDHPRTSACIYGRNQPANRKEG